MREEASVEILGELLPLISFEGVDERHGVVQRFVAFTAEAWSGDVEMSCRTRGFDSFGEQPLPA
jgi:hypothetical protein